MEPTVEALAAPGEGARHRWLALAVRFALGAALLAAVVGSG